MNGLVYDAGALIAAERRDRRFLAFHDEALAAGVRPVVPVVVLAQAWRGGPQPMLSRVLRGCRIVPDDERVGRAAGATLSSAGSADVVDAIVVVTAARDNAVVVTSDPADLAHIAEGADLILRFHPV